MPKPALAPSHPSKDEGSRRDSANALFAETPLKDPVRGGELEYSSDEEEGPACEPASESEMSAALLPRAKTESAEDRQWDFQNSLAFWASVFFIEGSALFTVGSVALYPAIDVAEGGTADWKFRAWVDWTFVIGAWCFTVGNFLVYHQVTNADASHSSGTTRRKVRYCRLPDWGHKGQTAAFCNCVGTLLFNLNTMSMFSWVADKSTMSGFNFWYFGTGSVGSFMFILGACFEGEHNNWRQVSLKRFTELPFLMSIFNFLGGLLFFVAYVIDVNRYAEHECHHGDCTLTIWVVCTPFTVGSICFLVASWMAMFMWKRQEFGVGFSKEIVGWSRKMVDIKQQVMIAIYIGNIVAVWTRLGFLLSYDWDYEFTFGAEIGQKLLMYHCILFLVSVIHCTPRRHPFDYLLYIMRIIAVYGFVTECVTLHQDAVI